jgi:hypothetical protein
MSRTITIDIFNPSSIDRAVREIREYSERVQRKTEELRERVANLIANDARTAFASAMASDDLREGAVPGNVDVSVRSDGDNVTVIVADGKDAVFMEFGAGVYYNGAAGSSPHPLGAGLGMTIGGYGKGFGKREVWGYIGDDGELHLTHGAPASMPLYRAVQSVARDIVDIAREVFASA